MRIKKKTWALQDDKQHWGEVVEKALKQGPQTITRHGMATAVVLSVPHFLKLSGGGSLVSFFATSPLRGVDLGLERERDQAAARDVPL